MPPPSDEFYAKIDTRRIYPAFLRKHREVTGACAWELAYFIATSGFRSPDEQTTLYLKGRETPGVNPRPERPLGDTVTNARAFSSLHQFGLAIDATRDAALDRAGLQPDWRIEEYEPLARNAKRIGLKSLFWSETFREGPHVELDIASRGLTLATLKREYLRGRDTGDSLNRVWRMLDDRGPW